MHDYNRARAELANLARSLVEACGGQVYKIFLEARAAAPVPARWRRVDYLRIPGTGHFEVRFLVRIAVRCHGGTASSPFSRGLRPRSNTAGADPDSLVVAWAKSR